jgi:beta-glucosidase-like glycosyl hydrolase
MVMLSSATYPSLGIDVPAVLSPETYRLLGETGFSGLIISDALDTPSLKLQRPMERRAVQAGVDLLLFAQTRGAAASAYRNLLADARAGTLPVELLRADAASILEFKDRLQRGEL